MPTPRVDEGQDAFISRCMGDEEARKDFPEQKQRAAVCFSMWRRAKGIKKDGTVLLSATITKLDEEQRIVKGWASVIEENGEAVVDSQGDIIDEVELEKAAHDFVLDARVAGEMHQKIGVGRLIESMVFTKDTQAALGIDLKKTGWWIGFKVDDDAVWEGIKSGKYRAFSIGGLALREEAEA